MPTSNPSIPLLQSPLLPTPHGMFCRHGGVSPSPHASLNLSYHVADQPERVRRNRALVKAQLDLQLLISAQQVHGDQILRISSPLEPADRVEPYGYDALITDQPGIGLLIQQADCQAVLLYDPHHQVIGAIHCGWKGSVSGIIGKTVERLAREYRSVPRELRAVISPSLGPCCGEFIHYREELPRWMHRYQPTADHFDFWAISRHQLAQAGLPAEQIQTSGICTRCNLDYFSHRRSVAAGQACTGRNGSVIALAARQTRP
ncbi:peptidoglycan editing factor PgeF [Desulfogranum mediterraneum]|uniref:peptidoglycan editing factor PgeF n=1 Tax=Desulfogranum mediterraneum TaxID=160661 RepID=UPI0004236C6E|nr:peptidoglycan editing factor PgeF [Desulfogranum mediterraneum]